MADLISWILTCTVTEESTTRDPLETVRGSVEAVRAKNYLDIDEARAAAERLAKERR